MRVAGQNNDPNISEPGFVLQPPEQFLPRHDGHIEIEHDTVRQRLFSLSAT